MSRSLISGSEHAKGAVSTALFLYAMIGNAPTFFYAPRRVQSTFPSARLRSGSDRTRLSAFSGCLPLLGQNRPSARNPSDPRSP